MDPAAGRTEVDLVDAIRDGDTRAFERMIAAHRDDLLRLARFHTDDEAIAEDALQETWVAVVRGVAGFEGRASFRTWLSRIYLRRLLTCIAAELRQQSIASRVATELGDATPAVPRARFLPAGHPRWPGHWSVPPGSWGDDPEQRVLSREARELLHRAISELPPVQRQVIAMRDIAGWEADEVCELLELSAANQRVLLHRARSRVRAALEAYFAPEGEP